MYYYTYAYLREDKTPYYIGKGKGPRIYSKNRKIKPPKDKSRIIYLKQNLTEEEAFRHEIYMIAVFGRKDLGTGILRNMSDGGEGSSGAIISDETRRKWSEARKGENNPNYGKTASEETRKKLSESSKGNTNWLGKTHSEETKRKISEANKNPSEETKRKIGDASKGRTHMKGKTRSEESKKRMSEARKGKKWWNDGCGNTKYMIECPGNGWRPGMK